MINDDALRLWQNTWSPETHETDYAKKRIISAKSAKLTPIKIDAEDFYGYFQGKSGRYETFLDYCPCGDFHRSKLPCKHIYRLAIELGLMNIDVETNFNAVLTPKKEQVSLDEIIDIIESLSEAAQQKLCNIASQIRSTTPTCYVAPDDSLSELIAVGIVTETFPKKYEIMFGKKNEITALLDSAGITYGKSAKKDTLQELCINNIPEKAAQRFGVRINVCIPTKFNPVKIHYYLYRKPIAIFYRDIDSYEFSEYQPLPDDDVTAQLIKRGYYSLQH